MKQNYWTGSTRLGRPWLAVLIGLLLLQILQPVGIAAAQSTALDGAGYRIDDRFPSGTGGTSRGPTGEKPESKLWWADGSWFAVLWSKTHDIFTIFRYNKAANEWVDTGTPADDRLASKADALWDGSKLYIASHLYEENTGGTPTSDPNQKGRLYRYSYNSGTKTFALDGGFPVTVNNAITETLVIAKDSTGTLWVTYVENGTVMVNHSVGGNDAVWGTPYAIPAGGDQQVNVDDIASIIAYNGRIGVMWSDQSSSGNYRMVFASHADGAADSEWNDLVAYGNSGDDHISIKSLQADSAGSLFAVVKTAQNSALVVLLVCKTSTCASPSDWTPHIVYNSASYNPTRPMLLIDQTNRELYVFTANEYSGSKSGIYYKKTSLDAPSFAANTIGTVLIRSSTETSIDDATSTKQNLNAATGLMLLASDRVAKYYVYNYLALDGTPPPAPVISGFSPSSGTVGSSVTISGSNFTGATSVSFNNTSAAFTVNNNSQITATVPAGATSGLIRVTGPGGTATSAASFTVTIPPPPVPAISGFAPASGPVGTQVTITGSNFTGASAVSFNGAQADGFTVDSATQIRAFVPAGATDGKISVTAPGGTATSANNYDVTTAPAPPVITGFAPLIGRPGTLLSIYGGGLSGATAVKIGNQAAPFAVVHDGQLQATVPAGVTSGKVTVTTPAGSASSAASFVEGEPLYLPWLSK